jgi:predicted nucleic acid-binding protein
MTVDDAVFVALAELTEQPLLTSDLRLARAAVEPVGIAAVTPVA